MQLKSVPTWRQCSFYLNLLQPGFDEKFVGHIVEHYTNPIASAMNGITVQMIPARNAVKELVADDVSFACACVVWKMLPGSASTTTDGPVDVVDTILIVGTELGVSVGTLLG